MDAKRFRGTYAEAREMGFLHKQLSYDVGGDHYQGAEGVFQDESGAFVMLDYDFNEHPLTADTPVQETKSAFMERRGYRFID